MGNAMFCSPCCGKKDHAACSGRRRTRTDSWHDFDTSYGLLSSPRGSYDTEESTHEDYEWYDALEFSDNEHHHHHHHHHGERTFDVTDEEMTTLRQQLQSQFPNDYHYMSDAYIYSVASKPYSKDMTRRRPLEYSMEKLINVMEWRAEAGAPDMKNLIALANGETATTDDDCSQERVQRAQRMVTSLNTGSMYWHGLCKDGRPILWVRTNRKYWYPTVPAEVDALVAMADVGVEYGMATNVTDFIVISHSYKPPPPNPSFAYQMLRGLIKGYPDRLHVLVSAPVSSIVEFCMNLLLPLMPGRMADKFVFLNLEHVQDKMQHLLWHGFDDIPTFFGGNVDHDQWYPIESKCPNRGKGSLKFDFYGMVERLKEQRDLFEKERQEPQQQQQSTENGGTKPAAEKVVMNGSPPVANGQLA